jgi:glycosyltransferase involved in cell wall biosynthesis
VAMNKQIINILSIEPYGLSFGGDETRLLNQCRLINKDEFKCIICAPKKSSDTMTPHFENANAKIIYFKTLRFNPKKIWAPVRLFILFINFLIYTAQLIRTIYKENIHVIDSRLLAGGIYGVVAKKITRLPVMVTIYHKSALNTLAKRFCVYLLRSSDVVMCDSKMRSDELREWIGSEKPEYLVIPSPIELKFSDDKEMEEIKREKEFSGKIIIGQIAGVIPFKGQDLLINAFHAIAQKHNNVELWIVGYPRNVDYYNSLIQQVKDLNIADKVRFISYPGYIGNIFRTIDIQVHASRFDSLPNSILEGMSAGKPLIACAVGGIPDVVSHEQTGLLFDTDDLQALTNCMEQLISDPDLRMKLGQAARKRFEERYSPVFLTKQLEGAITKLSNTH